MCYYYNNPEVLETPETYPPPDYPDVFDSWRESPTRYLFTYDEAYAAWQSGMPYYLAFCLNYIPVTSGGVSQCDGIEAGTVDAVTGGYVGP